MDIQTAIKQPNTTIVDVREPFEFQTRHLEEAISIPLGQIPNRLDEFRKMPGPIVLYCRSGYRSGQAANFLKAKGFQDVYNAGSLEQVQLYMLPAPTGDA